jgi:hypothetical protein
MYYKLTDSEKMTVNNTLWGENVTHKATGSQTQDLCSDGWIHFYCNPLIAVLMNPSHANFKNPIMWEGIASGAIKHESLKSGCESFTTIRQIPLPNITTTQRVAFGILCALEVCKDAEFVSWADSWLSGKDRNSSYIDRATSYAATSCNYTSAAHAAYAAASSYYANQSASAAAYDAAFAAAAKKVSIDFVELAEKAMTY